MGKIYFIIALFCIVLIDEIKSQSKLSNLKIGPEFQLITGGNMTSPFDFLMGARVQYDFYSKNNHSIGLTSGLGTDIGKPASSLISFDTQLKLTTRNDKKLSPFIGLGGHYVKEKHSIALIEGVKTWSVKSVGLTATGGLNYRISKHLLPSLYFRYSSKAFSSIGLNLNYSF
jgi:opacity protein-like surface antigen